MRSGIIKVGDARASHRSLLRATGVGDDDFNKPFIAVGNSYTATVLNGSTSSVVGRRTSAGLRPPLAQNLV